MMLSFRKMDGDMIIREKKQIDNKHSDLFIWVLACAFMAWIVILGLITRTGQKLIRLILPAPFLNSLPSIDFLLI
jgi:hypothetical protein